MNKFITDTLILVEDRRFYWHFGFDPIAIVRAAWANFKKGKRVQGGSTITQQLARTLYLNNEKTYLRKIKEILLAIYLEIKYTKEDILDIYMDNIYMGQREDGTTIKGFDEATAYYFNTFPEDLSITKVAALVGMIKGPNRYKPRTFMGYIRQGQVINQMYKKGIIE